MGLVCPLVAGCRRYMLTFPSPADILLTGANSGKLEERTDLKLIYIFTT